MFVNASPQRRDAFLCLQSGGTRLFPLHDVQTRWNSTFLMLRRARRLRNIIDKYCCDHEYSQFKVTDVEWRQIDYLVHLTKPFFRFTMALMKTKDVTIHSVFLVYRKLLEHIERSNRKLRKKTTPWKKDMYTALLAARQKLKEYYEKTYRDHGFLYGTGTLLAPQYKLSAFDDREYSTCHEDTSKRYCEYLRTCFTQYQQQNPELLLRTVHRASALQSSELDRLLEPVDDFMLHEGTEHDEVDQYLREANVPVPPRLYWREHEREFPVLSRLARDLLSVPATGAGVERLFNSARDICHYRRGSLHEATIQDLMMYMCSEKFTLEGQQLTLLEKPMEGESQEALEEDEALRANEEDAAPISDDEEVEETEDVESNIEPEALYQVEGILAEAQQPSMHNQTYDVEGDEEEMEEGEVDEDDEADLLPPPITQLGDRSQKRSSGRVTMPSSRLQGYEIY
ncbi:Zinc finger BED domain-containing protein DAYSLEEPER [Penicillium chrysogenum]|nr:Zinc finger BED domain-containing protein DAYSLEEPER [Penicillium chrysogenum]